MKDSKCEHFITHMRPSRNQNVLGSTAIEHESCVWESEVAMCWILSSAEHVKLGMKLGRPLSKAKHTRRPIANKYREGMVKRTPARGVKRT